MAIIPLAVGGGLLTTDSQSSKQAGIYLMMSGLSLAPLVSHAVAKEWRRAAIFAAPPLACTLSMVTLLQLRPQTLDEPYKYPTRFVFAILLAGGVLSSVGGVVDSLWSAERARKRSRLVIAPVVTPQFAGLSIGGSL